MHGGIGPRAASHGRGARAARPTAPEFTAGGAPVPRRPHLLALGEVEPFWGRQQDGRLCRGRLENEERQVARCLPGAIVRRVRDDAGHGMLLAARRRRQPQVGPVEAHGDTVGGRS